MPCTQGKSPGKGMLRLQYAEMLLLFTIPFLMYVTATETRMIVIGMTTPGEEKETTRGGMIIGQRIETGEHWRMRGYMCTVDFNIQVSVM